MNIVTHSGAMLKQNDLGPSWVLSLILG